MLFAATVCNAQVVLWDGTDKEVGSDGGFWTERTRKSVRTVVSGTVQILL